MKGFIELHLEGIPMLVSIVGIVTVRKNYVNTIDQCLWKFDESYDEIKNLTEQEGAKAQEGRDDEKTC